MKLGLDFLSDLNFDQHTLKETEIRLRVFAENYLRSPLNKYYFDNTVHLTYILTQDRKNARALALLTPFLQSSLFINRKGVKCWSNVIAKNIAELCREHFANLWQSIRTDHQLRQLPLWKIAYCMPYDAPMDIDHSKDQYEMEVRKEGVKYYFRKINANFKEFEKHVHLPTQRDYLALSEPIETAAEEKRSLNIFRRFISSECCDFKDGFVDADSIITYMRLNLKAGSKGIRAIFSNPMRTCFCYMRVFTHFYKELKRTKSSNEGIDTFMAILC